MVGVLDRLGAKSQVERERDPRDRRRVLVRLTETGRTVLSAAPSLLQDRLSAGLRSLPAAERSHEEVAAEAAEPGEAAPEEGGEEAAPKDESSPA